MIDGQASLYIERENASWPVAVRDVLALSSDFGSVDQSHNSLMYKLKRRIRIMSPSININVQDSEMIKL